MGKVKFVMKKLRLLMMLSLLLVCLSGIASAHTWDWVASSDIVGIYYSRGSAVRLSDNRQAGETGHVKAWFKGQYEDEYARQDQARILQEKSDVDTSNFYYEILQVEFKNVDGTIYHRFLNHYGYDYSGHCVFESKQAYSWQITVPGCNGMIMYERALADAR